MLRIHGFSGFIVLSLALGEVDEYKLCPSRFPDKSCCILSVKLGTCAAGVWSNSGNRGQIALTRTLGAVAQPLKSTSKISVKLCNLCIFDSP